MFRKLTINDVFVQIILVNLAIFLLANIVTGFGGNLFTEYFAMPLDSGKFLTRFWTVITYQFLHLGFRHIFGNMIIFLLFGQLTQQFFGKVATFSLYFVSGAVAGLVTLLSGQFISHSPDAILLGASGAVYGIAVATAVYRPNFEVNMFLIGRVKIKWIAIVLVVLGIVIDFNSNVFGNVAHLAGAGFGWLYAYQKLRHLDLLRTFNGWFSRMGIGKNINIKKKQNNNPVFSMRPKFEEEVPASYKVNEILDKITVTGLGSLTKEEKDFLDRRTK